MSDAAQTTTVLVATDGSSCAHVAVELVRSIHWPAGTRVHLVTALEQAKLSYEPVVGAEEIGGAASDLRKIAGTLQQPGVHVDTEVLSGRPATVIVDAAERVRADVVVLGSRGHGTIGSMVLGSVSAEVADHAHCPVLVARTSQLTSVLLATDGSPCARLAESVVATWPIFEHMPVQVASVAAIGAPWASGLAFGAGVSTDKFLDAEAATVAEHQRFAAAAASRLSEAGRGAEAGAYDGDPASELIRIARDRAVSMIVLGTHGRTGLRRILAGSVARNVMLHAPCSVMVVRETRAGGAAQPS